MTMAQQSTALVTGSSNGIGEAVVKKLAQLDYKLIVTGRNQADISRVASDCARLSPSKSKPLEIVADLSLEHDVDRLFNDSIKYLNGRLDLLVNNAGFSLPVKHTQPNECYDAYKRVMQVNVNSSVRLTLLAAEALRETSIKYCDSQPTSVIFIGSIASLRPTEGLAAYSTSKAAISMFARSIASEMGPLVRVNSLEPGPVATKIVERAGSSMELFRAACGSKTILRRIGSAEEIAEAVLFLADNRRGGFITGAQLLIDGGAIAAPLCWSS